MRADRTRMPVPGPARSFIFPTMVRRQLANGLELRAVSHHSVPVTALVLLVPGGTAVDSAAQTGLMSMTADLLDEGSHGASALEMSDRIARLGGDLDVEVSHDAAVLSFITLDRYLDAGLALLRDVAVHPNLTEADFDRVRQLRLERLRQLRDLPGALADRAFAQVLYQSHPYAQPGCAADAPTCVRPVGSHTGRGGRPSRSGPAGRRGTGLGIVAGHGGHGGGCA
jgi:zinc protease